MRPDLASLALFIRIAETKSITKAAAASHIALAAASRRVTQLEGEPLPLSRDMAGAISPKRFLS